LAGSNAVACCTAKAILDENNGIVCSLTVLSPDIDWEFIAYSNLLVLTCLDNVFA